MPSRWRKDRHPRLALHARRPGSCRRAARSRRSCRRGRSQHSADAARGRASAPAGSRLRGRPACRRPATQAGDGSRPRNGSSPTRRAGSPHCPPSGTARRHRPSRWGGFHRSCRSRRAACARADVQPVGRVQFGHHLRPPGRAARRCLAAPRPSPRAAPRRAAGGRRSWPFTLLGLGMSSRSRGIRRRGSSRVRAAADLRRHRPSAPSFFCVACARKRQRLRRACACGIGPSVSISLARSCASSRVHVARLPPISTMSSRWISASRPAEAQDRLDLARLDARRCAPRRRRHSAPARARSRARRRQDRHRIAAPETALDPRHAGRQQALALGQRLDRPCIHHELAARLHRRRSSACALLRRRPWPRTRCGARPRASAASGCSTWPAMIAMAQPAPSAILPASSWSSCRP